MTPYIWLISRLDPGNLPALVSDLHAANTALRGSGVGPQLHCWSRWFPLWGAHSL